MKIKTSILIEELTEITKQNLLEVQEFQKLSIEQLNRKSNSDSWSILECIEHLNLYSQFYIPEIKLKIKDSKSKHEATFKSGMLGNYFSKAMLPREKINKMKTFKDKNPVGSKLDTSVLENFIDFQKKTLDLLNQSNKVSLNKTKTNITISSWLKLKLGDTFRVVIYHNHRHIVQAKNVLKMQGKHEE